ncbi:D-alanyl-D-alanine carboxypeptidase/D-alanyl-D-alanine endopeptidase [Dyella lutea]|uniref:D-alanyl-D-alanine carboxypeptidase/D-alanyl-D-alanine-endopeptidase n=1 Tax=Dyella lutea TaxID=2950441 RepID=A0ABT1FE04_9GAMM|nr:D-alanyl-D-alanine carboxypeptidase/D-alanyl-D-alanine-endopeptidase [Dyella lutea]MCP1375596.1 D-alanyl-D-alanine carboxypeptidase/D-alanyl-D-alanine-endopeptidase [Dyella lutea]
MHRYSWPIAALLCLTLGLAPALAATPSQETPAATQAELARRIETLIDAPRFEGADWGMEIVSLDSGHTLYAHQPERLLEPASTAKLFTAALVLEKLGANGHTSTRLLARGPIVRSRLRGPLVLYGMGDPTLDTGDSTDWADRLATQLANHGIHRVDGDLIADDTYFQGPPIGAGWEVGDLLGAFAVPAAALSVQENAAWLAITPGTAAGDAAEVVLDPPFAIPDMSSRVLTTAAGSAPDINLYRAPGSDTLYAFGSVPTGTATMRYHLAMTDPARVAGELLREAMARHGVVLHGRVQVMHWPQEDAAYLAGAVELGKVDSPAYGTILERGLKRSQNLYLQNLLQLAGVQARAQAIADGTAPDGFLGSSAWGLRALGALLEEIGIAPTQVRLTEGSGLSRQNLVTASALVRLLQYMATRPYAATLRNDLPVAGVDGSLIARMRGTPAEGDVHAKTGSMTGVSALAGYVTSAGGEHLAFAAIVNHDVPPEGATSPSRTLDAIAELLATYRGRP